MNFILRAQDEGPQLWYEIPPATTSIYFTVTTAIGSRDRSAKAVKNTRASPEPNDSSTICKSFNWAKCTYANCSRRHECSKCASKSHKQKTADSRPQRRLGTASGPSRSWTASAPPLLTAQGSIPNRASPRSTHGVHHSLTRPRHSMPPTGKRRYNDTLLALVVYSPGSLPTAH